MLVIAALHAAASAAAFAALLALGDDARRPPVWVHAAAAVLGFPALYLFAALPAGVGDPLRGALGGGGMFALAAAIDALLWGALLTALWRRRMLSRRARA